jgi:hypothetical protein
MKGLLNATSLKRKVNDFFHDTNKLSHQCNDGHSFNLISQHDGNSKDVFMTHVAETLRQSA